MPGLTQHKYCCNCGFYRHCVQYKKRGRWMCHKCLNAVVSPPEYTLKAYLNLPEALKKKYKYVTDAKKSTA